MTYLVHANSSNKTWENDHDSFSEEGTLYFV